METTYSGSLTGGSEDSKTLMRMGGGKAGRQSCLFCRPAVPIWRPAPAATRWSQIADTGTIRPWLPGSSTAFPTCPGRGCSVWRTRFLSRARRRAEMYQPPGNQAERTSGSRGLSLHCSLATFHWLPSTLNSTVAYCVVPACESVTLPASTAWAPRTLTALRRIGPTALHGRP
jgi:hypothetical protein